MEKTVLTPNQRAVLESLAQEKYITETFFLSGGTALSAFYFKHRISEDFDLFSEKVYEAKKVAIWVQKAAKNLKVQKAERQKLTGQDVYYFSFGKNDFVKVDFSYFPFPHLGEFTKYQKLRISSLEDLAVNKLQAIVTRKRSRDYVDLYLCLRTLKWSSEDMQKYYRLKFDMHVSFEQLATSFTNVVDAHDAPKFLGKTSWEVVRKYFLSLAQELKSKIIE